MNKAGVILKTVEMCNMKCSYCYYFNIKDQSYKTREPYITKQTINQFVDFLKKGVNELNITDLLVEFHGGEPLMQEKEDFVSMCSLIKNEICQNSSIKSLTFSLRTNGTLIDEEWTKIFKDYDVSIIISLDGTKEMNDKFRLDNCGHSTYDKVVKAIKLCQSHNLKFGILSLVDPEINGRDVYRHFVDELKLSQFDFLIPDANCSSLPEYPPEEYGRFMSEVFNEWAQDNNTEPKVFIRFCVNALELFLGDYSKVEGFGRKDNKVLPLICVSNSGGLGPLDELRTSIPETFLKYNIANTSWKDFLQDEFFSQYLYSMKTSPEECQECLWEKACGGGNYAHRYSENFKDFSRKSVYCDAIKYFYKNVFGYFLRNGYSKIQLAQMLRIAQ